MRAVHELHNLKSATENTIAVLKLYSTSHAHGGNELRAACSLMLGTVAHRLNDTSMKRALALREYVLERLIFAKDETAKSLWTSAMNNAYDDDASREFKAKDRFELATRLKKQYFFNEKSPGHVVPAVFSDPKYIAAAKQELARRQAKRKRQSTMQTHAGGAPLNPDQLAAVNQTAQRIYTLPGN